VALADQSGQVVWLTGLPGAGKTTVAEALARALRERGRACLIIDGDALRRELCRDLGFSREDRREQCRRAAALARLVADQGLIAIVALVSPFRVDRAAARQAIAPHAWHEVHVATSAELCAQRDRRGLWTSASGLTGRDAPYEAPEQPSLRIVPEAGAVTRLLALLYGDDASGLRDGSRR
jgi:adenylyl-sulfate kinase